MPTKTACRDYNKLLPGFVTSDKPHPQEHAAKGARLSLSHSDYQLSSNNELFQLYTYFHIAMRSIVQSIHYTCKRVQLLCCIKALQDKIIY